MKPFVKGYLKKQQALYVADLKKRCHVRKNSLKLKFEVVFFCKNTIMSIMGMEA